MVLAKRKTRLLRFNRRADCNKYGYNVAGLLTTILRKNGSSTIAKTENTYDLLHRIETITQKNAADQAFASYSYTRKTDGKISAVDEVTNGANRRVEYTYDALGRLTQEKRGILSYDIYQLDLVGNRTKLTKHTGSAPLITDYVYDARDRLQTETTGSNVTSYTYDANGSQVTKDAPGADIETYNWDARNRLSGATINRAGTTTNTSYKYDDSGIRSEVTENAVVTKHLTDSMNPTGYAQVIEQTQGGVLLVSTVYGHEPIAQKDSSGVSLYLAEAHSGTRLLINVNAVILQQYVYDAYGILLNGSSGSSANPVLYRGERIDATLQSYYLRARLYNQVTGRFGSADNMTFSKSYVREFNKYVYTANGPINYTDPSGHFISTFVNFAGNLFIQARTAVAAFGAYTYALGLSLFSSMYYWLTVGFNRLMPLVNTATNWIKSISSAAWDKIVSISQRIMPIIQTRVPGGGLQVHEDAGGHAIKEHVGRTFAQLSTRLATTALNKASTFPNLSAAENAIADALIAKQAQIQQFLNNSSQLSTTFTVNLGYNVGVVLHQGSQILVPLQGVFVKHVRDATTGVGYRIQTAFPSH